MSLTVYLRHPANRILALLIGIFTFLIIVFGDSFSSMWDLWQTTDHRHGLLVFPISAFLIWQKRHELVDVPVIAEPRGLLLVVVVAVMWLLARIAGVQFIEHVAVLAMYPAVIITLAGWMLVRKLLFPILFLLLATPLGESLIPYLMVITADISAGLLKLSGIPLLRNGQYMSLPGGEFVVADVCAGLRYLVSGVMLSLLFGYLTYTQQKKRILLVAVTAITLVIANGLRAYIVMAVASATDMKYLGGRDHIYFGWLMFGVVMMLIMWIGARYADEDESSDIDLSDTMMIRASRSGLPLIAVLGIVMLAVTIKPLQADFGESGVMLIAAAALFGFIYILLRHNHQHHSHVENRSVTGTGTFQISHVLTTLAVVVLLLGTVRFVSAVEHRPISAIEDFDIVSAVPCSLEGPWNNQWQPQFQNPDVHESAAFDCDGKRLGVFVAAYASALQGAELISSSNTIVPTEWDRISSISKYPVPLNGDRSFTVGEIQIDSPTRQAIIWYWYEVDGRVSPSPLMTKINQVLAILRGDPAGGRVVVIETSNNGDIEHARARLSAVATSIIGSSSF